MIPLRLLKKAVFDKFDKDDDFDPSLKYFRYTQSSIDGTGSDNYPYAFYVFNTADDQLEMGDYMPIAEENVLTFHLFTLGDKSSADLESLMEDLIDELEDDPVLDIEQYDGSEDWSNPSVGLLTQSIVEEPETGNWHGIVRYTVTVGR